MTAPKPVDRCTETPRDVLEWLVSLDADDPDSAGRRDRRTVTLSQIIDRARAALAAPAFDIAADVREAEREETVARAICEADVDVDAVSWAWDGTDKDTRDQYREMARAAISADPGPDTADQLRQRVHDLADRHERSAAHRERLAARWTDAERHQLADAFRRLAHQSRVEALRVRAVAGPRRDEEATA